MNGAAERQQSTPVPDTGQEVTVLRQALIESRQRWRQFAAIAADMAFETDLAGRLSFVAPDHVLGWSAEDLVGSPARNLLLDAEGPDIFKAAQPQHRRTTWLRSRTDGPVCMAVSLVTMRDGAGRARGTRGIAVNVTEQEQANTASAAALRRGEVLDHILGRMRQEVLAPRMMQAMLEALLRALGANGIAVVDLIRASDPPDPACVLFEAGAPSGTLTAPVAQAFEEQDDRARRIDLDDGRRVLACPCSTRFGDRAALTAWRAAGARGWDEDDVTLIGSVSGMVRMVLEHQSIQHELARQARTDPLTGLLNRRAFMEEAARRLDRLERDGNAGTLMYLDLDRLKELNDRGGHEVGDAALVLVSNLLIRIFRPSDLIARLGGDEFAVWMDGADSLTAAERAEALRLATPGELGHLAQAGSLPPGVSIGIATRDAGSDETLDQMIQRADLAMYEVKRTGKGNWRVAHLNEAI